MTGTAYLLTLTEEDVETIASLGPKDFSTSYNWPYPLCRLEAGDNILTWSEARNVREAIEADMADGHKAYPGLDPTSPLCIKLHNLYQSII